MGCSQREMTGEKRSLAAWSRRTQRAEGASGATRRARQDACSSVRPSPFHAREHAAGARSPRKEGARLAQRQRARRGGRLTQAQGTEIEYRGWIYRDLLRPIAEVDAAGNVVARYVYEDGEGIKQNGLSQLGTRLGANQDMSLPFEGRNVPELVEELDASGSVVRTLSLVTTQVGTVVLVTDVDTGEVVRRLEHDEFGRVLLDSSPGVQPFSFAGGLLDVDTGFVRFGAPDYSAELGRWTSRDPVKLAGGSENFYIYLDDEPINGSDFNGLILYQCSRWVNGPGSFARRAYVCVEIGDTMTCYGNGAPEGSDQYSASNCRATACRDPTSDAMEPLSLILEMRRISMGDPSSIAGLGPCL